MARIVIFANGILRHTEAIKKNLRLQDRIFCADGGTHHALRLGLVPEVIIGDLDSLAPETLTELKKTKVQIYQHPIDKDRTDLELALDLAVNEKPHEILLLTALGGRLDQSLANILLLTQAKYATTRFILVDGPHWATVLHAPQSLQLKGQVGDTLSLIPLTPTVEAVDISGVKWPLVQANLGLGSTLSISNQFTNPQVDIKIGTGIILIIHLSQKGGL